MILVHLAHEANMIQEVFYSKSVWNMKHTLIFKGECTSIQHNAPSTIFYHYSQWQNGCQVLYKDILLENKDNFPETQYSTVSHLTDRVMTWDILQVHAFLRVSELIQVCCCVVGSRKRKLWHAMSWKVVCAHFKVNTECCEWKSKH